MLIIISLSSTIIIYYSGQELARVEMTKSVEIICIFC